MNSANKKSSGARNTQQPSKAVQPKMSNGAMNRNPSAAPPVYHPQPTPKVLHTKSATPQRPPAASPVYRPEREAVAQPKTALPAQARVTPNAAPVYRPQAKPSVQPPTRPVQLKPRQTPPPAQRSRPVSQVLQAKPSFGSGIAQKGVGVIQRKETFASVESSARIINPIIKEAIKGKWTEAKCGALASTLAYCMKDLANRVSIADGGKEITFRAPGSSYPGSERALKTTFRTFFKQLRNKKTEEWRKPTSKEMAKLYFELTKGQNLSEANHRGSYLIIQTVASLFEVYAPSANILGDKLENKIKTQYAYLDWFVDKGGK